MEFLHSETMENFFRKRYHRGDDVLTFTERRECEYLIRRIIEEGDINNIFKWQPNRTQVNSLARTGNIKGSIIYHYGNDYDIYNDYTILEILCRQPGTNISVIDYLLSNGAIPSPMAVTNSILSYHIDILKLLFRFGANPNETLNRNKTALQYSLAENGLNLFRFIYKYRIEDINYDLNNLDYHDVRRFTYDEQNAVIMMEIVDYMIKMGTNLQSTNGRETIWDTIGEVERDAQEEIHDEEGNMDVFRNYLLNYILYLLYKHDNATIIQKYYRRHSGKKKIKRLKKKREGIDRMLAYPESYFNLSDNAISDMSRREAINLSATTAFGIPEIRDKLVPKNFGYFSGGKKSSKHRSKKKISKKK